MTHRQNAVLTLLLCGLLASGCALIGSSASISDSISESVVSVSDSVSESSGDSSDSSSEEDETESAYRRDVSDLVAAWADAGAAPDHFVRDLGRLAERHGITDWERELGTYRAIGVGLRRAGLDPQGLHGLEARLTGGAPEARSALREGYES